MRSTILLVAFAALAAATPMSLSEMLDTMGKMENVPTNSTTKTTNTTNTTSPTTTTQNENQDVTRRDDVKPSDEVKASDELCDTVADLFNQGAEVNGTETTTSEARTNQVKGYSWDGPVYDGEKGFHPNAEYFDDDPDKPDGPSLNPPGGAQYPH